MLLVTVLAVAIAAVCAALLLRAQRPYSKTMAYCPHCASPLVHKDIADRVRVACGKCDFVFWDNPKPVTATLIITRCMSASRGKH